MDGDGVRELLCNVCWGDGAQDTLIYRRFEDGIRVAYGSSLLDEEYDYDKLGAFGVKVSVWNVDDAIVINKDCVYTQGDSKTGKRYVWVREDGSLSKRYVTVGYLDGNEAWIVQGLSEGEQIVLEKLEEEAE